MRKLRLDPNEKYNIYSGPSFGDIEKEKFLFKKEAASLTASEAANFSRERNANTQFVICYAAYADEPAAVL